MPENNPTTPKVLHITLVRSGIGFSKEHKRTLRALGFHRLHETVTQADSPSLQGMLRMVNHLVEIKEE
jgi:large subunit ribosomal protein L30